MSRQKTAFQNKLSERETEIEKLRNQVNRPLILRLTDSISMVKTFKYFVEFENMYTSSFNKIIFY